MKARTVWFAGRSEMLAAMNCIMHHLTDADDLEQWMTQAIGENLDWHLHGKHPEQRRAQYDRVVRRMNPHEWECVLQTFASIVAAQCFQRIYRPGAFSDQETRRQKLPDDGETGYCATCAHCDGVDDTRDVCKCRLKNPHADWRYNNNEQCPDWEPGVAFK